MPGSRLNRRAALLCLLVLTGLGALAVAPAGSAPGPEREPFFPRAGDPRLDIRGYSADLRLRPARGILAVRERVDAVALRRLSRFSLDLAGMEVRAVRVDGVAAGFRRGRDKLRIELPAPIAAGDRFRVAIAYAGRPRTQVDPDGTNEGWIPTDDGAIALGEPLGTPTWLAVNNLPADKAPLELRVTVPSRLKAVANGRLLGVERAGGLATYRWREAAPMSPYLAMLNVGRGRLVAQRLAGVPAWTLVDPRLATGSWPRLQRLGEIVAFLSRHFGPYPFDSAGSVVDYAPRLGYALETQSRPFYAYVPDLTTVVHETAHQWFGNSVGLRRWPQIWLNEGLATWTQWFYAERHGGPSARSVFNRLRREPASNTELWSPPPGRPGTPANLFAKSVYVRGAMTIEALRIRIGTPDLLRLIRRWTATHRHSSATIPEFVAMAEEVGGRQLDDLFERWLYRPGRV